MMETHAALASWISMCGLLFLVVKLYNGYRIDRLRCELFRIRDEMFVDAINEKLSLDGAPYQATRHMLNGMIRFTHRVSLVRFIISTRLARSKAVAEYAAELKVMLDSCGPDEEKLAFSYIRRANLAVAYHLLTSPFMMVLVFPTLAMILGRLGMWATARLVRKFKRRFEIVDGTFYRTGVAISGAV